MSYLDETYFKNNPVALPDVEHSNGVGGATANASYDKIRKCIALNEPKYLRTLMGKELFLEYLSDIDAENIQKWEPFFAKLIDTDNLRSPMANWIFIQFITENYSRQTSIGSVKVKGDNAVNTQPFMNQVLAWNDMVFQHESFLTWLYENKSDFEGTAAFDTSSWDYLSTEKAMAEGYFL